MAAKEELWAGPEQLLATAVCEGLTRLTDAGCWSAFRGVAHIFRKIFLPRAGNGKPESL
jgi:hypothetical protein